MEPIFDIIECTRKNFLHIVEGLSRTGIFFNYQPFKTHFAVTLNNVEEVVAFVATHDNLHLEYVKTLLKMV